jgi:hypothetical protein
MATGGAPVKRVFCFVLLLLGCLQAASLVISDIQAVI